MKIVYHLTVPPPAIAGTDALIQEVNALQAHFGGEINALYPFKKPGSRLPRLFYGLHQTGRLRRLDAACDLHHIFNPNLYIYPALKLLKRPLVYTVVASLGPSGAIPAPASLANLRAVTVSNERDFSRLAQAGYRNLHLVRPAIDTGRFHYQPLPVEPGSLTLLVGSAPWTLAQFEHKGVNTLLALAQQMPGLRLIFLWRGLHLEALQDRIRQAGLQKRVEVINQWIDVDQALSQVHAAIVLADHPTIVKAYPHSLIESLAAGKPVIASQAIPMADYVIEHNCGKTVEKLEVAAVEQALHALVEDYPTCQTNALLAGQRDFSTTAMLEAYDRVYRSCIS